MGCHESRMAAAPASRKVALNPGGVHGSAPAQGATSGEAAVAQKGGQASRLAAGATESESTAPTLSRQPTPRSTPRQGESIGSLAGGDALGRYSFGGGERHVLGQGAFSVCYLGTDLEAGASVAIKEYKLSGGDSRAALQKLKRQVAVLLKLQEPFRPPSDKALWSKELSCARPSDLFVQLLDYSRDAMGKPGRDPADGSMYVVTELAERTLKAELQQRRETCRPLSAEEVRACARDILLAVAGLHAKGLVHLDLKPENIVLCGGRWKLIDMDGCARAGTTIFPRDDWVSFSPCYCAPEFATFVIKRNSIDASPSLDAWSVGITLAELVNLQPVLRHRYQEFCIGQQPRRGGDMFLRWLGSAKAPPRLRHSGSAGDEAFYDFLESRLLVVQKSRRKTIAECLSAPYFAEKAEKGRSCSATHLLHR